MRYARWMLCAVAVAAMVAPSLLFGQDNEAPQNAPPPKKPARAPKKKPARLRGKHALMAKEVSLTVEQQAKVRQAAEAEQTEREAWEKENGPKVKELREQLNKLNAQRSALRSKHEEALMAILTPEQQVRWKGFVLYQSMMRRFRRAKLTDEQAQSVRTLCGEAVKDDEEKSARERNSALGKKIQAEVLTDEQREELKKPRPRRKPVEKKPKVAPAKG